VIDQPAAARLNGTTRLPGAWAGGDATAAVRGGAAMVTPGFRSTAHPGDRLPQWTHLRKIWPGSHHMP